MGNENSKSKEPATNGINVEKHANGGVNGLKAKNNQSESEATVDETDKQKGEAALTIHTNEAEHVIVKRDGSNVEAQVIAEKDVPTISTEPLLIAKTDLPSVHSEAQFISQKEVPTIQKEVAKEPSVENVSRFRLMFKKKPEPQTSEINVPQNESSTESQATDSQPECGSFEEDTTTVIAEKDVPTISTEPLLIAKTDLPTVHSEAQFISQKEVPTIQKEVAKEASVENVSRFRLMFKKKPEPQTREINVPQNESSTESQATVTPPPDSQPEPADIKEDPETSEEPKSVPINLKPEEAETQNTEDQNGQLVERQEESDPEQNPVMNFFKTLVTSTKTQKKESAAPDVTKDQPQKETPTTVTTTTVAQVAEPPAAPKGMCVPPPPPPEPPRVETKGDPAAKQLTPPRAKEEAAKQPEASKGKSASLSNFFRAKIVQEVSLPVVQSQETVMDEPPPVLNVKETMEGLPEPLVNVQIVEEVPQPVVEVEKVDASKTKTLEADFKPEPVAPAQEDKKAPTKTSFLSRFKPKVLVNQMATKVQAASTSGVRLLKKTTGVAAEPKKETSAPPAVPEPAHNMKAKEEPKAVAKPAEPTVENKSGAPQGGDESANVPKKLEKRNSIHLFFKNLGQKRHSIEAGAQTEAGVVPPPSEKTK